MTRHERALASAMLGMFAIIVVLALVYTLLDPAVTQTLETASAQADHSEATSVIDERERIWDNILLLGILFAGIFIVAKGVIESRRPG